MSVVEQIQKNLVDPKNHSPILKALIGILEEQGERGVKDRIRKWVQEIRTEQPALAAESEE
jgi:hypothetical protein